MRNWTLLLPLIVYAIIASGQSFSKYQSQNYLTTFLSLSDISSSRGLVNDGIQFLESNQSISAVTCDHTLMLAQNPIPPNLYQASSKVIGAGVIQSGLVVIKAGDEIELMAGFEVENGGLLDISIGMDGLQSTVSHGMWICRLQNE